MLPLVHDITIATMETFYMVFVASYLAVVLGGALGLWLFLSGPTQACENRFVAKLLGFIVDVTRSIPFIILMIAILPLTRWIVGTSIGTQAAMVPLVIAAIPFFARIAENAFQNVPRDLLATSDAYGATTLQLVRYFLIPESMATLIRGATLMIIGLIGYSAMAGAVGGGGLGELAIQYGYQRFDVTVMTVTVVLLVVMVQAVQWYGDRLSRHCRLRGVVWGSSLILLLLLLAPFATGQMTATAKPLRVGIVAGPMQDVLRVAQTIAKRDYDLVIEPVVFEDYILPNTALNDGDIDANIFQHVPYLNAQIKSRGYKLKVLTKTFVYPMGIFSKQISSLRALPANAVVAIPNDPSNEARALLLMQKVGLIRLKKGVTTLASVRDINANPKRLRFKPLAAAQLPRVFDDATLVALTNDYVKIAGVTLHDALVREGNDSLYANVIVVRDDDTADPRLKTLAKVMHDQAIVAKTMQLFPAGAAVKAW